MTRCPEFPVFCYYMYVPAEVNIDDFDDVDLEARFKDVSLPFLCFGYFKNLLDIFYS